MPDIDTIDRDADLYFILLRQDESDPGGLYRSELKDRLEEIDGEPFPFETFTGYGDFMENLRFLAAIGAIDQLRERRRITLQEKGLDIADQLVDSLTDDQADAIQEVTPDAD